MCAARRSAGSRATIPDADPNSSPHGLAVRFQLPGDAYTDIVVISYNGFPVATPEDFLALLNSIAATKPDSPKPTPVSFGTLPFYGMNAMQFTNAQGESRYGRYRIVPVAGVHALSDAEAAKKPANYLMDELPQRIAKGPVKFKLLVQLAAAGDPLDDGSAVWPAIRKEVELGTIVLTKAVADSAAQEKTLAFNPLILPEGIAPSADPILLARPAAYAVSLGRRYGK